MDDYEQCMACQHDQPQKKKCFSMFQPGRQPWPDRFVQGPAKPGPLADASAPSNSSNSASEEKAVSYDHASASELKGRLAPNEGTETWLLRLPSFGNPKNSSLACG